MDEVVKDATSTSDRRTAIAAERIRESVAATQRLLADEHIRAISASTGLLVDALRAGRKLLLFGNGGSAADAQHIAGEFVGRFLLERRALPAIALSADTASITAIGNDYGFSRVFARQVEALGTSGDVAWGISTSGESENVVAGLAMAREMGLGTIGLTGSAGGRVAAAGDVSIRAPADQTPRIQECHLLVAHVICELVEIELQH